jgi:hypothetical protein
VPDAPEEDMDAKGGGQAADDARVVKAGDEDHDNDKEATAHRKGFKGDITPPPGARSPAAPAAADGGAAAPVPADGARGAGDAGAGAAAAGEAGGEAGGAPAATPTKAEPVLEADEKLDALSPPLDAAGGGGSTVFTVVGTGTASGGGAGGQ